MEDLLLNTSQTPDAYMIYTNRSSVLDAAQEQFFSRMMNEDDGLDSLSLREE
jgi:hypothetical protein